MSQGCLTSLSTEPYRPSHACVIWRAAVLHLVKCRYGECHSAEVFSDGAGKAAGARGKAEAQAKPQLEQQLQPVKQRRESGILKAAKGELAAERAQQQTKAAQQQQHSAERQVTRVPDAGGIKAVTSAKSGKKRKAKHTKKSSS